MLSQPNMHIFHSVRSPLWRLKQAYPACLHTPILPLLSRAPQTPASRLFSRRATGLSSTKEPLRLRPHKCAYRGPPASTFTQNLPASRRPISSGQRFHYYRNQYNRFAGTRVTTLLFRLLRNAKPEHYLVVGVIASGLYLYNTDEVEMTGRRRFNCISHRRELMMGAEIYQEILDENRGRLLPDDHPLTEAIDGVLQRLIPQAHIEGAEWKVHVINDDNTANAFVLPGGQVFVYTGIMPMCRDMHGVAAVLGHEIAHVIAHHYGERMSHRFLSLAAIYLISFLFDISGEFPSLFMDILYKLPNSRIQEAEADSMGLTMMSKACYNPEAAADFWARMQEREKQAPPQFMSTHPATYNRLEAIRGWMLKAMAIYQDSGCEALGFIMPAFQDAYSAHESYDWE